MKVAVTGKGGVGKTTLAAALARTFARSGADVVALDADPNPNLGIALGLGVDRTERLDAVVNAQLRDKEHPPHDHGEDPTAEDLLEELGVDAPDGVRLVQTGRVERPADGCLCCGSHRATRRMFDELSGEDRVVVADLEAGVTDLCWTNPKPADAVVVIATPDRSAVEVARRAIQVTRDLEVGRVLVVVNRVEMAGEADEVRQLLAGAEIIEVPEDAAVTEAERLARSPLDVAPDCPAVRAVRVLADRLSGARGLPAG